MKKILALLCAAVIAVSVLAGCAGGNDSSSSTESNNSDWSFIENNGKLTIGITYFEPMNYIDKDGKLTGFETEFAEAVCKKLGVKANFQKIDWETKEVELNAKTIDCIWNGMTIDDERKQNMDISTPYMENKQVMVVKSDNALKFTDAESLKDATVVAEKKSAGETVAQTDEFFKNASYISVDSQAKALMEVKSGTADVAIIDYVMSIGSIGEGTDYADLSVVNNKDFAQEQYGIAFRKNSPETLKKVNAAIQELANEGTLNKIAEKYKLNDLLLIKPE